MNISPTALLPNPVRLNVSTLRQLHLVVHAPALCASYTILAQSRNEVRFPDNSPSISMWPYLLNSDQTSRLDCISVYTDCGTSSEQMRLLYMNRGALRLWREMRMPMTIIGETNRPPGTAMLSFGTPFSE